MGFWRVFDKVNESLIPCRFLDISICFDQEMRSSIALTLRNFLRLKRKGYDWLGNGNAVPTLHEGTSKREARVTSRIKFMKGGLK